MGNLHIGDKAFFAREFVRNNCQVSDALHDVIPERRHLIGALQVSDATGWYGEDDVVKLQLSPGGGASAQDRPLSKGCHTWEEQDMYSDTVTVYVRHNPPLVLYI